MKFERIFFLFFALVLFWGTPIFEVEAQLSRARCDIAVYPNGHYPVIQGVVTETNPGRDPSTAQVSVWTDGGGSADGYGVESASATINGNVRFSNGNYVAYVSGNTSSNPGGGSSSCFNYFPFTVDVPPDPVYGCMDPSATNYNPNATHPATCTYNPPPSSFNVTTSYCFGWPNPRIEVNLNPSSGANYYALQKWNGSSYQTIFTGSYQEVDRYEDTNISMYNTYWYRVVAYNNYGSTPSNNEVSHYPTPSGCGQSLQSLSTSISSGSGSISGNGISCPSGCSNSYDNGTWVTITAYPSTGYAFSSWSGACSGQGQSCSLYMNSSKSTSANFSTNSYTLNVYPSGSGSVTGSGISCGGDCSETYPYGTSVSLTANPSPGYYFSQWGGECSGSGSCTVSMTSSRNVYAYFVQSTYSLSVSKNGTGSGTVSGTGINCGSSCSNTYNSGTAVSLSASPAAGSLFAGWGGTCSGSNPNGCSFSMDQGRSVTATFNIAPFDYSLSNSGTSAVTKASGNVYTTNTITKTLTSGLTQSVPLTISGVPSGTSYSLSAGGTCSPTCSTTITFTVSPSTRAGTYPITVSSSGVSPARQTTFNLVITGSPFSVSCSVNPATTAVLGQNVTFSATVSGGVPPLTYSWSGLGLPTSPAPSTNPFTTSFSTIGTKSISLTVRDADNVQSTCPPATITITFDPNFEEF